MTAIAKVQDGPAAVPANADNLATACALCSHNCGLRVDVKDNVIVEVRADDSHPATQGYSCNKAYAIAHYVGHKQRVTHPLKKQPDGTFARIGWDQAINEIAAKLSFTTTHVRNLATLAAAPKAIVNLIVAGKLSASTAVEAIRKHGPVEAARLLKDAASRAEADGKPKISAAHLPGARFARTLKKTAPRLYEAARQVREDPAYDNLRAETRQTLDELLAQLAEDAPASSESVAAA